MSEKIRVLVVEDELLIRMDIVDSLEQAGFVVFEASHAQQAMKILSANPDIRVLFTDINMPGDMDGQMLAKLAAERWPPLKIILTSGFHSSVSTRLPGTFRFIDKPYDPERVINVLKEAVS